MKLVGATIQPDSLPDILNNSNTGPQNFQPALLELENIHSLQIASLDLAFAGLIDNQLSVAPILGLKADTQWDIARNLTRIKALHQNIVYDRTIPHIRQYQTELAKKIVIPDKLFLPADTTIPIAKLLVVNYWESSEDAKILLKPQINLIVDQEGRKINNHMGNKLNIVIIGCGNIGIPNLIAFKTSPLSVKITYPFSFFINNKQVINLLNSHYFIYKKYILLMLPMLLLLI